MTTKKVLNSDWFRMKKLNKIQSIHIKFGVCIHPLIDLNVFIVDKSCPLQLTIMHGQRHNKPSSYYDELRQDQPLLSIEVGMIIQDPQ